MRHEIIDPSQFELTDKVVSIKRVSKTVKGGRTMRFTALVVVGDGNGHIGAGLGKATEIPEAIRKGKEDAMKKLIHVDRRNQEYPYKVTWLQQQAERRSCYAGSTEADEVSGGSCKTSRKICRRDSGLGGLNNGRETESYISKIPD